MQIVMSAVASEIIDQKRLSAGDIETAVSRAEESGLYFKNSGGVRICALQLENLMYWVCYSPRTDDVFEVQNAYCHRMKFEEAT